MYRSRLVTMLIAMLALDVAASKALSVDEAGWVDTYYQYRIPVVLDVEKAGWNVAPIDQTKITERINRNEEMQFDPLFFAYNQVKVVEVDGDGNVIDPNTEAGFYLVSDSEELCTEKILY